MRRSADVGRRRKEIPPAERGRASPCEPRGPRIAALAGLAGAWIAAGSSGLLAHPLRHGLTWAALGCTLLAGWRKPARPILGWLLLAAAGAVAVPMIASDLPPLNVLAVALALVAVAQGHAGSAKKTILLAAEATVVLGVFRLAYTSIGWFWLLCDATAAGLGSVAGWITRHPLSVGATMSGLDFLVVMLYLALRGPLAGRVLPRAGTLQRIGLAVAVVLVGHLIYLNVLTFVPTMVGGLSDAPPAPDAWHPYPPPKDFDKTVETWVKRWPKWESLVRWVAPNVPYVGRALRELIPWNLPLLAMLIHLVIGWVILRHVIRFPASEGATATGLGPPPAWRHDVFLAAAILLAVSLPAVTRLSWHYPDLWGKKIVLHEKGYGNWLRPTYPPPERDRWSQAYYGRLSIGMYGMLPVFLESLGAYARISPDLSESDLTGADVVLLPFPHAPWEEGQLERIWRFVRGGGTLVLLGEHTIVGTDFLKTVDESLASRVEAMEEEARKGKSPPRKEPDEEETLTGDLGKRFWTAVARRPFNRFNELLEPTSMRVAYDAATFAVGGWLQSYEVLAHPAAAGIPDTENQFGAVIGASVEVRWPAVPLLVGRWGWNDRGNPIGRRAMLGNGRYDSGERLGDVVLAAEQRCGAGRIVAFGDTSTFNNGIIIGDHPYASRLFAYLADPVSTPQAPWRQVLGIVIFLGLVVVLAWQPGPGRLAAAALGLAVSLAACTAVTCRSWAVFPDGNLKTPNNVAYIDESHLGAYSREALREDGLMGLQWTLMRNDYLTLMLPELSPWRLKGARILVCIAPAKEYSPAERETIVRFVREGGILIYMVGYEKVGPSRSLLSDFRFDVGGDPEDLTSREPPESEPLGHFKSPYLVGRDYQAYVRYWAAWPIDARDRLALLVSARPASPNDKPVILLRRVGKGLVTVVGDTCFAMNKNLEREYGELIEGMRENADFWRWFISLLRDGVGEGTLWFPPRPKPAGKTDDAGQAGQPAAQPPAGDEAPEGVPQADAAPQDAPPPAGKPNGKE